MLIPLRQIAVEEIVQRVRGDGIEHVGEPRGVDDLLLLLLLGLGRRLLVARSPVPGLGAQGMGQAKGEQEAQCQGDEEVARRRHLLDDHETWGLGLSGLFGPHRRLLFQSRWVTGLEGTIVFSMPAVHSVGFGL